MIAGIYGMNFDNMPELKWHYGYFIVVGIMAIGLPRALPRLPQVGLAVGPAVRRAGRPGDQVAVIQPAAEDDEQHDPEGDAVPDERA